MRASFFSPPSKIILAKFFTAKILTSRKWFLFEHKGFE